MNRRFALTLALVAALALQATATDWSYYRRDGSRYHLTPCDSLVTIRFVDEDPGDQAMATLQTGTALADDYEPVDVGFSFWQFGLESGADLDTLIADLMTDPEIQLVNPVFELEYGRLMYAADQIILRPKPSTTQQQIEDLFDLYELAVVASPDSFVPFYLVALTGDSPRTVFGVADSLFDQFNLL